jgi:thiol:disulfide interchange protein DsbA
MLSLVGMSAFAAEPVEGTDYIVLTPARPTSAPNKIVVTEFFSYQCPHCFHFSFLLDPWVAKFPSDIVFERIPVSFGRPEWGSIAQAFYSLQAMGKLDAKLDTAIFDAIHEKHIRLSDLASISDWLVKQGVSGTEFNDTYNSFGIRSSMTRAEQAAPAYGIDGVPTIIIDGKYRVPSKTDMSEVLAIADQLIAKVRAARGMPAPQVKPAAAAAGLADPAKSKAKKN